jgi:hypothetical protein
MHVHALKNCIHDHVIFFSSYKIAHIYILLGIIYKL